MRIARALGSFTLVLTTALVPGQPVSAPRSQQFPRFTQKEGQLDADGLPVSGAKLCVIEKENICYQMPSETYPGSDSVTYEFGLDPHSERLHLADGGSWYFFPPRIRAAAAARLHDLPSSDTGERRTGRIVNLLPWVGATNVSEWAMWTVQAASAYPVLVHADFLWGEGETHFSRHFYKVEAWKFDPRRDRYVKAFEYRTSRKYDGGDVSPIRVLGPERQEIIRRFKSK